MFTPLTFSPPILRKSTMGYVVLWSSLLAGAADGGCAACNTLPTPHCVVVSVPILCPPHEYISASICVGGRPTFISYSSTVFRSKWSAHPRLRPALSLCALPPFTESNLQNVFFHTFVGAAKGTLTVAGRRGVNDYSWDKSAKPPSRRTFCTVDTHSGF